MIDWEEVERRFAATRQFMDSLCADADETGEESISRNDEATVKLLEFLKDNPLFLQGWLTLAIRVQCGGADNPMSYEDIERVLRLTSSLSDSWSEPHAETAFLLHVLDKNEEAKGYALDALATAKMNLEEAYAASLRVIGELEQWEEFDALRAEATRIFPDNESIEQAVEWGKLCDTRDSGGED